MWSIAIVRAICLLDSLGVKKLTRGAVNWIATLRSIEPTHRENSLGRMVLMIQIIIYHMIYSYPMKSQHIIYKAMFSFISK